MRATGRIRRTAATIVVGVSVAGAVSVLSVTGPGVPAVSSQPTTTVAAGPAPSMTMTGTMAPGGTITVEAAGFAPGATVSISMDGSATPVGSGIANALGRSTIRLTIPADMTMGPHTMVLAGAALGGAVVSLTETMTIGAVLGAATTPAEPTEMTPVYTG